MDESDCWIYETKTLQERKLLNMNRRRFDRMKICEAVHHDNLVLAAAVAGRERSMDESEYLTWLAYHALKSRREILFQLEVLLEVAGRSKVTGLEPVLNLLRAFVNNATILRLYTAEH